MLTNALFDPHPSFALCFTQSPSLIDDLGLSTFNFEPPGLLYLYDHCFSLCFFFFCFVFLPFGAFSFFLGGGWVLVVK
jgi:hypothetical protein